MSSSVIICAYTMDRWDDLVAAVDSCISQSARPDEIVVVIDYNDQLLARAQREFVDVTVVANVATKGLSGARNTGVATSSGDVIAFIDDDAFAEPQWLEELTLPMTDSSIAGVGGWVVPHWAADKPRWFPETFYWVLGCSYEGLPADGSPIRNPIGANMAIRRQIFDAVGGFTDGIGRIGRNQLGCEETELCIRYAKKFPESEFVISRGAIVHHRVPMSRLNWHYFWKRCWAEGLSKAAVTSLVGSEHGLSSERRHVTSAIPHEIIQSMRMTRRHPRDGVVRIALILAGSACAVAGLLRGIMAVRRHPITSVALDSEVLTLEVRDESKLREVVFRDSASGRSAGEEMGSAEVVGELDGERPEPSPVRLIQIEIGEDQVSLPLDVSPGDRVMIEVVRQGRIVGVVERRAESQGFSASILQELAAQFADSLVNDRVRISDEQLPLATVVVPTIFQRISQLTESIESLLAMNYPNFEIIVVDNRPDRNGQPLPLLSNDLRVRVEREPILGISAARNRGIAVSKGDFIAFTDDDVVVDPGWLRELARRFVQDPGIDAIGGMVRPKELDTKPQYWFEEYFGGFSKSFRAEAWSLDSVGRDDPLFPYAPGKFAAGCNMAIRKSTLQRLGGFNVYLGTGTPSKGGEDLAKFIDIILAGGTVVFEPNALVRHSHRRSEQDFMTQVFGYGTGLSAMYTALIVKDPRQLLSIVRCIPAGLRLLKGRNAMRSAGENVSYPRGTQMREFLGMMYGPFAYGKSMLKVRRRV
jgi:glycosyltransferase involved in cell wall biosynthesis